MNIAQLVDIAASATILTHVLFLRFKKPSGWLLGMVGNLLYGLVGLFAGLYGLVILESILLVICFSNYLKWKKDERNSKEIHRDD